MSDSRLDARFKDGTLYVFHPREVQVIKAWPELTAVRKQEGDTRWRVFGPDYPLIRPYRSRRKARVPKAGLLQLALPLADGMDGDTVTPRRRQSPAERRGRAFHGFRFACPRGAARRVEPFRGDHLPLLRLLLALGPAGDLLDGNPALGYCLALWLASGRGGDDRQVRDLAACRQPVMMTALGLPDSRRACKALSKVRPASMGRDLVRQLPRLLADEGALKVLGHLPSLGIGALSLAMDPQLRRLITPTLLEEVQADPRETYFPFVFRELTDALQMADALGVDLSRRRFQTRARIRETHEDLTRDYVRLRDSRLAACRFPPPPIPGGEDILPLRAPRALVEEGRQQNNCVAGYAERVASGDTFIYRVLRPQRATLSIERMSGRWQVGELLCAHNQPVSAATRRCVEQWLDGHRL
ncbi:MAG: PcfJ domain-containing protein [Chromatiaceae bacterium]